MSHKTKITQITNELATLNKTFEIKNEIFQIFPNAQIGVLILENIDNTQISNKLSDQLKKLSEETYQKYYGVDIESLPSIKRWSQIFSKFGINRNKYLPSHEALLKRVIRGEILPEVNSLVDIYNLVSLQNLTPIGGHDIDKISSISVGITSGSEIFLPMNSDNSEVVEANKPAYLDESNILTRNLVWRQGEKSKTTKETRNVFIPIDDILGDLTQSEIKSIAQEITALASTYLKLKPNAAKFGIVNSKASKIKFIDLSVLESKFIKITKMNKTINNSKKIEELLSRGVDEVIGKEELLKKLDSGETIKVYIGIDPTSPSIHIGNAVPLLKLRDFMELGHEAIFLVGAFTALIGDTSDKESMRPALTLEQVENNFQTYKKQANKILDFSKVKIVFNQDWLANLGFVDIVKIAQEFTLQPFIQRELIKRRLDSNQPIGLHEVLYPIMQGYDSYHLDVDVELGGIEQRFNMLAGRDLQRKWRGKDKAIITNPYILGTDGRKMSKSWGNTINVDDSARDKYMKLMRVSDEVIIDYLTLGTRVSMDEIKELKSSLDRGDNPMIAKKKLAYEMTKMYEGDSAAHDAEIFFENTVQKKEIPTDIMELKYVGPNTAIEIAKFLVEKKIIVSNAEAKRLIQQGGFEIDGKKVTQLDENVDLKPGTVIKAGKKGLIKLS